MHMKNHEKTDGWLILWIMITCFALLIGALAHCGKVEAQTAEFQAQWTYGGEADVEGFRLYWSEESGTYVLGYQMPLADYLPPPAYMTIPIALPPGEYVFVVTAYDDSGNESDNSNEAALHVQDVVKPSPCQGLKMRLPVLP